MKVIFVSATREDDKGFGETPLILSLSHIGWDWAKNPIHRWLCNSAAQDGLGQAYNQIITNEDHRDKVAILVHDDVHIEDSFFLEKIEQAMKKYDIVGLAGTTEFNIDMPPPIAWFSPDRHRGWKLSGAVAHPNSDGNIFMSSYGLFDQKCVAIDGLFMAVNVGAALDVGLSFDEQFKFHFYDLDFCLTANKLGLKIGTWPIWVTHQSRGESVFSEDFGAAQELFLNKWRA